MKRKLFLIVISCFFTLLVEGSEKDMLKECPNTPNCISSETTINNKHYIDPITFNESSEVIKKRLINVIEKFQGKILENKENYLKVAFYSKFFGFEDIADFEIEPEKKIINIRSAAQTGWYDFGVNRKRMEKIRAELKQGV